MLIPLKGMAMGLLRNSRRVTPLLVIALFATALAGCSGGNSVPLFPAEGKLTVAGQPAEGAMITLVPDGSPEPEIRPAGRVDAEGRFKILTYDPNSRVSKEGARPGVYVALVTWVPEPSESNLEMGVRDRLGNRYRSVDQSKFRIEVKEGTKELAPIDLPKSDLIY
jgi:hypothetical protein